MKTKNTKKLITHTMIRISKKAHKVLAERATKDRRTIVATLDIILGV